MRTSGPFVSRRTATLGDTARVLLMTWVIPSFVMWAVFIRTTFTPASTSGRMNSTSQRRSEIVATILVFFIMLNWGNLFVGR